MPRKWYGLAFVCAIMLILTLRAWLEAELGALRALVYLFVLAVFAVLCWLRGRYTSREMARQEQARHGLEG